MKPETYGIRYCDSDGCGRPATHTLVLHGQRRFYCAAHMQKVIDLAHVMDFSQPLQTVRQLTPDETQPENADQSLDNNIHFLLGQLSMADEMIADMQGMTSAWAKAERARREAARQEVVAKLNRLAGNSIIIPIDKK